MKKGERKFFLHETSHIDKDVKIGENTKIWHFSHIQSGSTIGRGCTLGQNVNVGNNVIIGNNVKIQNNVSIYEGVELEDYVFCGPSMVFTNIKIPRSEFPQNGSEYYLKTKKDNKHLTKMKFIEHRNFLLNNINDFFQYNLNQNTLLRSIENRFSNE